MKIVKAEIIKKKEAFGNILFSSEYKLRAELEDGTITDVFSYYPDELHFSPEEFIGKTIEEAKEIKIKKDIAYLQS